MTIAYQEADEPILMGIFKKFKIKTIPAPDYGDDGVPAHVADAIIEGLDWIEKRKRGEVKAISWEQMMEELKTEAQEVKMA